MVTPEMIGYIKSQQRAAVTEEEIRQKLKQNGGWTDADLDEAFSMIRLEGKAAPTPAPVAAPAPIQSAPAPASVSASVASSVSPAPSPATIKPGIAPIGSASLAAPAASALRVQAPSAAPAPVARKKGRGVMGPLVVLILLLAGGAVFLYVNGWMLFGTSIMDLLPFGSEESAPMVMEEENLEPSPEMTAEESVPSFLNETKDLVQISKDIANSQMQAPESTVPTTE